MVDKGKGVPSLATNDSLYAYTCIAIILITIIIIVGCIGNSLVILAVRRTKKLQTISNQFVVNLSICDLLFVTMVLPFNIYTYIEDGWYLNKDLCKFIGFLGYTLTGTTIITITLIAWNRYKLVLDPSGYTNIFIPLNLKLMMLFSWIFPIICLLPALTEVWGKFGYEAMLVTCNLILDHESQSFKLFLLIVRAVVPCILIVFYYTQIFFTTRDSHRRMTRSITRSALDKQNICKEMHLTKMMIAIFVVFILSYFPCTISSVIDWNTVLSKKFHMFCVITVYLGSAVNPLIYGLMNSQFRLAYFKLLNFGKSLDAKKMPVTMKEHKPRDVIFKPIHQVCDNVDEGNHGDISRTSSDELLKIKIKKNSLPELYHVNITEF